MYVMISCQTLMKEGEETKGKLAMNTKRKKGSRRDTKEGKDMFSELPDCVLVHVMGFMDIKSAIQTCVLSKRWKDLWKHLTSLTFRYIDFGSMPRYNKFVYRVLSTRDGSISLYNLDLEACGYLATKLMKKVMQYVVLHNVSKLRIYVKYLNDRQAMNFPTALIFSCSSLTSLKIDGNGAQSLELPKSLHLPALKNLYLEHVRFTAPEPFSICNLLNTLVLKYCQLCNGVKVLCISNSNLSSLSLEYTFTIAKKIVLSTPNLSSLAIRDSFRHFQLSSTHNLSVLEEVIIDILGCSTQIDYPSITSCLQMLNNVKTMTLSSYTLRVILNVSFSVVFYPLFVFFCICQHICQYSIMQFKISIKICLQFTVNM